MQQEWREEDEAELRAGLSGILHRIAVRCAHKDSTVWPQAVSARMAIPAPEFVHQGPSLGATDKDQNDHGHHTHLEDMLAGLGLACW